MWRQLSSDFHDFSSINWKWSCWILRVNSSWAAVKIRGSVTGLKWKISSIWWAFLAQNQVTLDELLVGRLMGLLMKRVRSTANVIAVTITSRVLCHPKKSGFKYNQNLYLLPGTVSRIHSITSWSTIWGVANRLIQWMWLIHCLNVAEFFFILFVRLGHQK